ncbi:HAMP domain-containing sensor histidine kinase [Mucilaginibacter sp. AK015]|uniref:sensor histidine kinase n=1 Tax=Mucilaginibacter sp. AK015 TaxID=2723072 RepID=UPI001617185F|nr:HAMP domain-containing sensor histidine kinase [Mucilaginibacter sp. AK015]MBB5396828.1 signal transduction histidine kinase [Mucilaginibacter sp. AK015]
MKPPKGKTDQSFFTGEQTTPGRGLSSKALTGFRIFFYLGCVTSIVLVVIVGMTSYRALNRQQTLEKWVEHTYKVLRKTDSIAICFSKTLLLDSYMQQPHPYQKGFVSRSEYQSLTRQVNGLIALVKDSQLRSTEIWLLRRQIDTLFQISNEGDTKRVHGYIRDINETLRRIKQLEESLLLNRENAYTRSGKQTQVIIVVGSLLILLIVSCLIYVILTELKSRMRAYQEEHELNQLKSSFITLASHEFRTPLSSVLLSATLIERYLERNESVPALKHAEKIRQVVHNLESILEDFLSLDQLEEGLIKAEFTSFDLVQLCRDAMLNLRLTAKPGQQLVYDSPTEPQMVNLDSDLIEKSLSRLISNAIKYAGDNAHIWLTTEVTANGVIISVKDNGLGIAEEDQKKLSTLFYRVDSTGNIAGTGLGLNIVKRYVQLMGGTLGFSSIPNEQTCFTMTFPNK